MERDRYQRQTIDYTSPAWRLLAVGLFFGGLFFGGWAARILGLVDQFSTFFVLTAFTAFLFWAKKRPDKLRRRFGAFGKVAIAIQESADDIRQSIYSRSIYYGILFGMGYAVVVIAVKTLVVAVATSLYAWQITAMAGCLVAAAVVAPQFVSSVARHVSLPDEDPEESREIETAPRREAIGRRNDASEPQHTEKDGPEEREDAETRESNSGIGFYDEEGNELTAEEFEALVARGREEGE